MYASEGSSAQLAHRHWRPQQHKVGEFKAVAFSGIRGHKLEITAVGCNRLKDAWYGRHKPYVSLKYGTTCYRTKTCRDGGKTPSFNEKFEFSLIEELHELSISICSSHKYGQLYRSCKKLNLEKFFSEGYITTLVPLQSLSGRQAGEASLSLHYYPNASHQKVHLQAGVYK